MTLPARPTRPICRPRRSVLDDAVQGTHAILPSDLLALAVRAAAIGDPDLVHASLRVGDLGGDLRLEAEPILFKLDRLDELAAKRLVARLHIGQVEVRERVG